MKIHKIAEIMGIGVKMGCKMSKILIKKTDLIQISDYDFSAISKLDKPI